MSNGFSIGRIFGIRITIDWSWIFIFLLVVWNLGAVFSSSHPDWSPLFSWSMAVIAALLFFASVLAHELAHSLVARAQGLPVRNITLFMFGGVSNIQREPPSPSSEFTMAIVGPVTSIVLGFIFLVLGWLAAGAMTTATTANGIIGQLNPVATILLWLGPINLILGVFNLIPGFPLDGGRVLRSILWGATNNLRTATRWAAWVGQGIGWLMILAGIAMVFGLSLPFFGQGLLGGLWLAFIGWFLNNAAVQSYKQVAIQDVLDGVPVARMMRTDTPTVPDTMSVAELVRTRIMATDLRAFPAMHDDQLVGLVCLDDVRKVPETEWAVTPVSAIMTPVGKLVTATPDEDAAQALNDLAGREINQLPVVQGGRLVGMLRRRDILKWLQLHGAQLT